MKVAQINGGVYGSTGRIMFGIADLATKHNIETCCFSPVTSTNRYKEPNKPYIKIGSFRSRQLSVLLARITGFNGCFSLVETYSLLIKMKKFNPDIMHLHNLHDSYINIPMLFSYIKKHNISVVWTLHDCWALTGHCTHFTLANCDKWKSGCGQCKYHHDYPISITDNSSFMWKLKRKWFANVKAMTIVTPSKWLADIVKDSFLGNFDIRVINNGIDLSVFRPTESNLRTKYGIQDKRVVLGVAMPWNERKGFGDFLKLSALLPDNYVIILVGLSKEQIQSIPDNVIGIERTNSAKELAELYSISDVFVNPTYEDNFPTVNLEARACGTPVITYDTGGSPESAGCYAKVVKCGDVEALKNVILSISTDDKERINTEELDMNKKFEQYIDLYRGANSTST